MRILALIVITFLCCLQLVAQDKEEPKFEFGQQDLAEFLKSDTTEEEAASPLIETDPLTRISQDVTITESMLLEGDPTSGEIDYAAFAKEWESRGKQFNRSREEDSERGDLTLVVLAGTLVAEIVITAVLLFAALSIQGSQNTSLSALGIALIVGLSGLICEFALGLDILNPLRFAIGGVLLLPLILALTPIKAPLPAILIAIPVRIISVAIVWGASLGLATIMQA